MAACAACQRFNIGKQGFHPLQSIHADLPGDHWAVDLWSGFRTSAAGNNYILVIVCVASRFAFLRPLPDKQMDTVGRTLFELFCDVGFPKILQSDNGTEFANQCITALCKAATIDRRLVTPYHPRGNGLAERTIQTTMRSLKKAVSGQIESLWDTYVPGVQYAYNVKVAGLHGSTPFSLMYARAPNAFQDYTGTPPAPIPNPETLQKRLRTMQEIIFPSIAERSKARQTAVQQRFTAATKELFPVGSTVMSRDFTRTNKTSPVYEGPYTVLQRTRGGSYVLQDLDGLLLPRNRAPSQLKLVARSPTTDDPVHTVESILNHRGEHDTLQYLVKWQGYAASSNSWEPPESFVDIDVIRRYWSRRTTTRKAGGG